AACAQAQVQVGLGLAVQHVLRVPVAARRKVALVARAQVELALGGDLLAAAAGAVGLVGPPALEQVATGLARDVQSAVELALLRVPAIEIETALELAVPHAFGRRVDRADALDREAARWKGAARRNLHGSGLRRLDPLLESGAVAQRDPCRIVGAEGGD